MKSLLICLLCSMIPGFARGQSTPSKLTPQEVEIARQHEKQVLTQIDESKKHPGKQYSVLECRADVQHWTSDGSDKNTMMFGGSLILVNGQVRILPPSPTPHVTMAELMERVYEMSVCTEADQDFQKQFSTYSMLEEHYKDEEAFRYDYFLVKHDLRDQFFREDAAANAP